MFGRGGGRREALELFVVQVLSCHVSTYVRGRWTPFSIVVVVTACWRVSLVGRGGEVARGGCVLPLEEVPDQEFFYDGLLC